MVERVEHGSNHPPTGDARRRIRFLDLPFDAVTFSEAVERLLELAEGTRPCYAVTANVDHVVRVHQRPELRKLYEEADLVVADGTPLIWASRCLGTPLPERVAGSDMFPELCARAAKKGLPVFFMGGDPGAAEGAADRLREAHSALNVVGIKVPPIGFEHDERACAELVQSIRAVAPRILFVGLGSPKQELWISRFREQMGVPLSLGIGISFSFAAGMVRRAPRWMRAAGLEWAHRLSQEPRRLWRRYLIEDRRFAGLVLRHWRAGRRRAVTVSGSESRGS